MTRTELLKAMEEAEKAFNNYLEENNFDPAYFQLELTGFLMTTDFSPLEKVRFFPEFKTVDSDVDNKQQ